MTLKKSEEIELHKKIRESFNFDRLKMLMGKDYVTKSGILIKQPTMEQISEIGEEEFYRNLNVWVTNTTSYRLSLWKSGVDWCKLTDFELFCSLYKAVDPDVISIILPELDISSFEQKYKILGEDEYELVLYSEKQDLLIDAPCYLEISQYLRFMFNIFPKVEYGKGKATREAMIAEDEQKIATKQRFGGEDKGSNLFFLVSFCVNHPGFKYRLDQLDDVGIYQFMDAVSRLQVYENTRAMLTGSMSGFVDTKGIKKENYDFTRDYTVNYNKHVFTEQEKEKFKQITVR